MSIRSLSRDAARLNVELAKTPGLLGAVGSVPSASTSPDAAAPPGIGPELGPKLDAIAESLGALLARPTEVPGADAAARRTYGL